MTPEKLEKWLARERPRAGILRVLATVVGGADIPVHEWTIAELKSEANRAGSVLDVCQDYCDSRLESVMFRIEICTHEGATITCTNHRASPIDSDAKDIATDADLSTNRIIAQFMRHDERREQLLISNQEAFFKACTQLFGAQGKVIENLQHVVMVQQQQLAEARAQGLITRELTEEEKQEMVQRAAAWQRASELAPLVLQAFVHKFVGTPSSNGAGASASNGKAA